MFNKKFPRRATYRGKAQANLNDLKSTIASIGNVMKDSMQDIADRARDLCLADFRAGRGFGSQEPWKLTAAGKVPFQNLAGKLVVKVRGYVIVFAIPAHPYIYHQFAAGGMPKREIFPTAFYGDWLLLGQAMAYGYVANLPIMNDHGRGKRVRFKGSVRTYHTESVGYASNTHGKKRDSRGHLGSKQGTGVQKRQALTSAERSERSARRALNNSSREYAKLPAERRSRYTREAHNADLRRHHQQSLRDLKKRKDIYLEHLAGVEKWKRIRTIENDAYVQSVEYKADNAFRKQEWVDLRGGRPQRRKSQSNRSRETEAARQRARRARRRQAAVIL